MNEPFLRQQGAEVTLAVRVQPRASRTELGPSLGAELKVRISAPPVDDAANEELVRFLARQLGCPRSQVRLLRGRTSRSKLIGITGVGLDQLRAKLRPDP